MATRVDWLLIDQPPGVLVAAVPIALNGSQPTDILGMPLFPRREARRHGPAPGRR